LHPLMQIVAWKFWLRFPNDSYFRNNLITSFLKFPCLDLATWKVQKETLSS
jgi:hypothetical protein